MWRESELRQAHWSPPGCLGWNGTTRLAGAIAGTFTFTGGLNGVLDRIGAFSRYRLIRYWSESRRAWEPLALEAGLVASATSLANRVRSGCGRFRTWPRRLCLFRGRSHGSHDLSASGPRTQPRAHCTCDRKHQPNSLRVPAAIRFVSATVGNLPGTPRSRPLAYFQAMRAGEAASPLALSNAGSYIIRLTAFYGYVASRLSPDG